MLVVTCTRLRRPALARAVAAVLVVAGCLGRMASRAAVPVPSETPARVIVSGRTSTVKEVKIVRTGKGIPETFSGKMLKNTPGFDWYVSQHYALKTDYPEQKARFYLTMLELAYPHYVELFGAEPADMDKLRMAAVYGSSKRQLGKALMSDGIVWDFRGGGITFESGYRCSYVYPSGSLKYHQRYILLHEATHLFQMCLAGTVYNTPNWYYEGVADALGAHVYDSARRQLTVDVFDKPTTHDYFDEGLREFRRQPETAERIFRKGEASRGKSFLLIHFFLLDPDRAQKLRLLRDELRVRRRYDPVHAGKLLQELLGPWPKINAEFDAWRASLHNTFHYAEWGWEQDADALWSYGFAPRGKLSRTDVYLIPNGKPAYDPLRMDYPLRADSRLVGDVARGAPEPSVGCVLDFSRNPAYGRAGIGLGLIDDEKDGGKAGSAEFLRVLVVEERQLLIDGRDLGIQRRTVDLPKAFRQAAKQSGHRIGMNIKIATAGLHVRLRAGGGASGGPAEFSTSVPITPSQRERLLSRPLAVLARDGYHGVTPVFDDRRREEPDLLTPAPPNRWRNAGDKQLWMLYRCQRRLGRSASASLLKLKAAMLKAVAESPEGQARALEAFDRRIAGVLRDIRECGADGKTIGQVTADVNKAVSLRTGSGEGRGHAGPTGR